MKRLTFSVLCVLLMVFCANGTAQEVSKDCSGATALLEEYLSSNEKVEANMEISSSFDYLIAELELFMQPKGITYDLQSNWALWLEKVTKSDLSEELKESISDLTLEVETSIFEVYTDFSSRADMINTIMVESAYDDVLSNISDIKDGLSSAVNSSIEERKKPQLALENFLK
ncbi:MAG: hypothetical protein ACI9N1_000264 [Flavobacteriales bacterium]|jgi:hypothetical protein